MSKLMIVGATLNINNGDVEVVNLGAKDSTCFKPLNIPLDYGSVGTFMQGQAFVCGDPEHTQCYTYDNKIDRWNQTFQLVHQRYFATGVQLSENEWWIVGGKGNSLQHLTSTEICSFPSGCTESVNLPVESFYPKTVRVNETHIFVFPNHTYIKEFI